MSEKRNTGQRVVKNYGPEWQDFNNEDLTGSELSEMFRNYMSIFPWGSLPEDSIGFDAGCGSGRWAKYVAPKVGTLHCVDASSEAIEVARKVLSDQENVVCHSESINEFCI